MQEQIEIYKNERETYKRLSEEYIVKYNELKEREKEHQEINGTLRIVNNKLEESNEMYKKRIANAIKYVYSTLSTKDNNCLAYNIDIDYLAYILINDEVNNEKTL